MTFDGDEISADYMEEPSERQKLISFVPQDDELLEYYRDFPTREVVRLEVLSKNPAKPVSRLIERNKRDIAFT